MQPALILEEEQRYLVITDIHIGFESSLISNDIHLEPKDLIKEIHNNLEYLVKLENPDALIILGDVKSGIDSISKVEWDAVPLFFEIGKKIKTVVVPGNHDGNLQRLAPDWITLSSPSGIVIGDSLLTHGHVMPSENLSYVNKIVMGHLHPIFFHEGSVLDGQQVWVSIKANKNQIFPSTSGDIEIIIVPSFNKYFYSTFKRHHKKSISPILEHIHDFHSAKIVTLDGSIIGNESFLQNVL